MAAGVLAVGALALWARSVLVGVAYAVVGGFLVLLVPINWHLAASINEAPPVLPEPVATIVGEI
jgi:hypothetical protein